MQNIGKWLVALTILIVVLLIALNLLNRKTPQPSKPVSVVRTNQPAILQIALHPPRPAPDKRIMKEPQLSEVLPEKIEECLKAHGRNAGNLLAAFRISQDTNYLHEAAQKFPDDPTVQLAVLSKFGFPDRRKWLDAFKASSPSNSLAFYLSAQEYFWNGNTNAALQELLAADSKLTFAAYTDESRSNQEELAECSEKSASDAARLSMRGFSLENNAIIGTLKHLVATIGDLQEQSANAGDKGSVEKLAAIGMNIAAELGNGDSGKYLINQIVTWGMEARILKPLDQNKKYDFLDGKTPAEILQENKQQKIAVQQLNRNFLVAYPDLTDDEMLSYQQHIETYGELAAMQWVVQQHPPPAQQ